MSLAKSVPDGLKPQECKRSCLREPPSVPYVPEKDKVQEEVSKMKNLQLKTSIDKDTTLIFPVWYSNKTKEAMLMHVMATLNATNKHGDFKAYNEAQAAYVEQNEAVKLANASLSLLDGASKGSGKSRKTLKKAKEAKGKAKEAKGKAKEAKGATKVPNNPMRAIFQADLEKAKEAAKNTIGAMITAAN